MAHIQLSAIVPGARQEVFDLLCSPERLSQLLQDQVDVVVTRGADSLRRGAEYEFLMTRFGLSQPVRLRVEDFMRGTRLTYRQAEGLFKNWLHTTKFEDHGDNQTLVTDFVDYQVPFGFLGYLADDLIVRKDMRQLLERRLKRAKEHFESIQRN